MNDVSIHFKSDHIDFLIEKIELIDPENLIIDDIELLSELTRFYLKGSFYTIKGCKIYWKIICSNKQIQREVLENAFNRFCENMKNWDMKDHRISVLFDCIQNISKVHIF